MASRTPSPSRRAAGGRSSSSSRSSRSARSSGGGNNQLPIVLGVGGALVLVLVLVLVNSSSGGDQGGGDQPPQQQKQQPAGQPGGAASGASGSAAGSLSMASAKAGKSPSKPAPALSKETLDRVNTLLADATTLFDDGYKLKKTDQLAESKVKLDASAAKLDELKALIEAPLRWQEEADFEDWAQPAEYMTLARLYGKVSTLENKARKMGAKR